jgi:hypothetical protein
VHNGVVHPLSNTLKCPQSVFLSLQLCYFGQIKPMGRVLVADPPASLDCQDLGMECEGLTIAVGLEYNINVQEGVVMCGVPTGIAGMGTEPSPSSMKVSFELGRG